MGKRTTSLKGGVKSKKSHKTAKRLEVKHEMLTKKAAKKNVRKSSVSKKKKVVKKSK